jgi:hypothetical protein
LPLAGGGWQHRRAARPEDQSLQQRRHLRPGVCGAGAGVRGEDRVDLARCEQSQARLACTASNPNLVRMQSIAWLLLTYKVSRTRGAADLGLAQAEGDGGALSAERRVPPAKTDDHVRRLKMLENDIAEAGGESAILEGGRPRPLAIAPVVRCPSCSASPARGRSSLADGPARCACCIASCACRTVRDSAQHFRTSTRVRCALSTYQGRGGCQGLRHD